MCFFSSPKVSPPQATPAPEPAPPPTVVPTQVDSQVTEKERRNRVKQLRLGIASTIKTPLGINSGNSSELGGSLVGRKTLG